MPLRTKPEWTEADAEEIGTAIGISWNTAKFDVEAFLEGLLVELEHGSSDARTDVTGDDPEMTGKIAWAHLLEDPDYYTILKAVEDRTKEGSAASFLPSLHDVELTLGSLTKRYAAMTKHRVKILRRATSLAATIAALEPTPRLLSDETALRRLAENAFTAADHLDGLANDVPAVKQHEAAIRVASRKA